MKILSLNAGSRSVKGCLYDVAKSGDLALEAPAPLWRYSLGWSTLPGMAIAASAASAHERSIFIESPVDASRVVLADFSASGEHVDVVAHRVVRSRSEQQADAIIDEKQIAAIAAAIDLAPDHNPFVLAAIAGIAEKFPAITQIAVSDSAFHNDLPEAAAVYALPLDWHDLYGIQRVGFHGLSHAYSSQRVGQMWGCAAPDLRIVSCHLGGGASLAAVRGGRSVDTTMGFTPLEGLVMETRSGSIDPGIILYLLQHTSYSLTTLDRALRHDSGLRGISGRSGDMREILIARGSDPRARLAFDVYVHRLSAQIAAMAVSLGGLDALVFTGGVGANSCDVRAAACQRLAFLGSALDSERNALMDGKDGEISAKNAKMRAFVVQTREEWEMARAARVLVARGSNIAFKGTSVW